MCSTLLFCRVQLLKMALVKKYFNILDDGFAHCKVNETHKIKFKSGDGTGSLRKHLKDCHKPQFVELRFMPMPV